MSKRPKAFEVRCKHIGIESGRITMGDRNLIQLKPRDVWHYWNFGSMMPICGAGSHAANDATMPAIWEKSRHADTIHRRRTVCPVCFAIEATETAEKK